MTATVLQESERTTADTAGLPKPPPAYIPAARDPHAVHGLVAITNGDDYCLCGNVWPCRKRSA